MKHAKLYVLLVFVLTILGTVPAEAQSQSKISTPDLDNWSDERLSQWEDSVKAILYPIPEICITPVDAPKDHTLSSDLINERLGTYPEASLPMVATIDQSKAVGEIPIIEGTSPMGGITYQVPINIYPGPNNIQPNIALSYNSSGSNGPLGVGWGISGTSRISRTNQSVYYDGKTGGISRSRNDVFVLDGMRLIKKDSSSNTIRYQSEQGNIIAIAHLNGNVFKYFEVLYPNGSKAIFGFTNNISTRHLEYPLTKLTDIRGNVINFDYEYAYNHYLIRTITYGDNAGASVNFKYETGRPDPVTSFRGGVEITENKRLKSIVCKYGSNVLHTYGINYKTARNSSVIGEITYTAGTKSFNPLIFNYGTGNTQSSYNQGTTQLYEWYNTGDKPDALRIIKGKFDYGSDDDGLISLPNSNAYWHHYKNPTWIRKRENRYVNLFPSNQKIFFYAGLNSDFASPIPHVLTEDNFIDIFCANVDGKYEEEIIKVNNGVNGSYDKLTFKVYTPNLYSGLALKHTRTYNFPTVITDEDGGKSIHPKFYFSGDFNGNGKMEVLAVSCHNPLGETNRISKCYLFDLDGNRKLFEGHAFPYVYDFIGVRQTDPEAAFNNTDRLFILDYDGDGKSDICHINDQGVNIYTFNISGSSYSISKVATYTGLKKSGLANRNLMLGELDGDGLIDLVVSPTSGSNSWSTYHAMGNGQFYKKTFTGPTRSTGTNNGELLQDVNGDGMTDLIKYSSSGFYTYLAKNGTFSSVEDYESKTSKAVLVPTNINSRNIFSRLIAVKDGKATRFVFQRDDSREKLLSSVSNSLGVEFRSNYMKLNSSGGNSSGPIYSKGSGASYPYENFEGPLWVLSTQETWLSGQKKESKSYHYENAVIHKQGLGFCGFQRIHTYDNIRGRSFSKEINPYNYSVPKTDESPTEKNTYNYTVNVETNKIRKVRLTKKTTYDKHRKITVTTDYNMYDTYGNLKKQTDTYPGGITIVTNRKYANSTSDSNYLLGFLYDQTTTTTRNGSSWTSRFYYPAYGNGLPNVRVDLVNGKQVAEENCIYDNFGKVKRHSQKSFSSAWQVTNYGYDAFGHVNSETNPMGQKTEYHYNTKGELEWSKNHWGQQTDYKYDEFGRLIRAEDPLGLVETNTYTWDQAGSGGIYCIGHTATGQAAQKSWFDALGREVRNAEIRFDGTWAKTDRKYDSYGRLQKTSMPFTGSSATQWNTYSYYSNDRPRSLTLASGKKTSYSYDGLKTTTNQDEIATTRTYDALGTMIESTDPGGTITYNLRPDGQPASIEAPGGVTTRFSYDIYGRQDTIVDPSAGIMSYGYDTSGNLNKQTDAEGRVTTMLYDSYGRIKKKTSPELTTDYVYNSDERLESITSDNGTKTNYSYDTYGRLNKLKENGADGYWLEKTYKYKADGNIDILTYKTQSGIITSEHFTYSNGYTTEIKLNGTTSIFKLNTQNELGQPTKITTGAVSRTYGYNQYGIPTGRTAGNIMSSTYNFEAVTGNLLSRKDNKRNKTENFKYDGLNRLTNYGNYTAAYDGKGNLTKKTDVGSFDYTNTSKPYAISGATLTTNAVPVRSQHITYNSFEQPVTISENNYLASFTYNAEGQRVKMELKQGSQIELVRHYLGGCYEKDMGAGGTKEKLYLGGDYYSAPAVYVKQGTGSWQLYYICRDYLGSITHLAASTGSLTQELSFGAWGRLRSPASHTAYAPGSEPTLFLGRGYIGHEHLPWFGLINMNGRLYDPGVGRFLSPDNYVQLPDFSQNLNRYSYGLNNPLKYTDPDGEFWHIVIGAVIGGVVNVVSNWDNIDGPLQGVVAFGVGAGAGALTAATGGAGAGVWATAGVAAVGSAAVTGSNSIIAQTGENFSGFGDIDWGQVGISSAIGGVSGFAGGAAGSWAANSSMLVNGINSPLLRTAVASPLAAGTGHIAGGTTAGLFQGQSLERAFGNSFNGIGQSMAFGTAIGVASTVGVSYANKINPLNGRSLNVNKPSQPQYDFTPDPYGDNITMYRGTTGSEGKGGPLFMTDSPEYAATYVKNGGQVVKATIPRLTYLRMQQSGYLQGYQGIHNGIHGYEYKIHPSYVKNFLQLFH